MSTIRTNVRSWWTLAALAGAIAIAAIAPSTASADYAFNAGYGGTNCAVYSCYTTVGAIAPVSFSGYAHIDATSSCPIGANCLWANPQPILGYRWTGYGWQRYQVQSGVYYVAPYSGKWRWVLTGQGWLIVGNANFSVA